MGGEWAIGGRENRVRGGGEWEKVGGEGRPLKDII